MFVEGRSKAEKNPKKSFSRKKVIQEKRKAVKSSPEGTKRVPHV